MVENLYPEHFSSFAKLVGNLNVGFTWVKTSRRVVVCKDNAGAVEHNGGTENFPGVNLGAVQESDGHYLGSNNFVGSVEEEDDKVFLGFFTNIFYHVVKVFRALDLCCIFRRP